jgi:hydroxymethylpyrimidine pyrophosphatase-like HAD family hydrolase
MVNFNTVDKVNLIFPVAGKGERFGGTFKPFLKIGDITFIEKTMSSFSRTDIISKFYFICTQNQEVEFNVSENLSKIIGDIDFELIIIPEETSGPYQTIRSALKIKGITGKSIICDCDHYLNGDDILEALSDVSAKDIIIPTYQIEKSEFKNWSKIILDGDSIKGVVEKEDVDGNFTFKGIIGCIGFKEIGNFLLDKDFKYVSDLLNHLITGAGCSYSIIDARDCLFYGDPQMYEKSLNVLRSKMTIFCDIDGVLIKHNPHSVSDPEMNEMIDGFQKLEEWRKMGHKVVLTTARNSKKRKEILNLLEVKGIKYDDLLTSCNPGQRILINDRKPSSPFLPQSLSFEITRDHGIKDIEIDSLRKESAAKIIGDLSGNSFAKTYLIENLGRKFIRKHIIKKEENYIHYEKLKRQYLDIKRLNFLNPEISPSCIGEYDSNYEYYYDIEYLSGYKNLSDLPNHEISPLLYNFISVFKKEVYSLKKHIRGEKWMDNFLSNKIYNKLEKYSEIDENFRDLIESDSVIINGKAYRGLRRVLNEINYSFLNPSYICPIHGDFTLENMMSDGMNVRTIDMDGSDYFDAPEQDLGKLSQSILSRYHIWNKIETPVFSSEDGIFTCEDQFFNAPEESDYGRVWNLWRDILSKDEVTENAIFYMSCYFIRFVPFRLQKNKSHGYFAIIMAIVWLNKIKK